MSNSSNSTLSRTAETKDFARLTSQPVRGWTGKKQSFLFSGDLKWPPCDKGLLNNEKIKDANAAIALLEK